MPRPTLRIDREHTLALLVGKRVTIKVPRGAETLTLACDSPVSNGPYTGMEGLSKLADVFFNGRKA